MAKKTRAPKPKDYAKTDDPTWAESDGGKVIVRVYNRHTRFDRSVRKDGSMQRRSLAGSVEVEQIIQADVASIVKARTC